MGDLAKMLGHDYLYPDPDLLVTFLGLHDVARFMNEKGASLEGLKLAFTYLMTSRGIPMIYYGDEIGMPGGEDPDNRRDFPESAFETSGRTAAQGEVFEHVRKLARLRARTPALRTGPMIQLAVSDTTYAYSRGQVIVLFNNGASEGTVECDAPAGKWHDALGTIGDVEAVEGKLRVKLPARSAAILEAVKK